MKKNSSKPIAPVAVALAIIVVISAIIVAYQLKPFSEQPMTRIKFHFTIENVKLRIYQRGNLQETIDSNSINSETEETVYYYSTQYNLTIWITRLGVTLAIIDNIKPIPEMIVTQDTTGPYRILPYQPPPTQSPLK